MTDKSLTISILGGGHGGFAEAAYLSLMGYKVTLYNRTLAHIVSEERIVELLGSTQGTVPIYSMTDSLQSAVEYAKVIFIILPAYAHKEVLTGIKKYLINGQIVVLMPGKLGGGLEAVQILHDLHMDVTVFETESVVVGARRLNQSQVYIHGIKRNVKIGGVNIQKDRKKIVSGFELLKEIHPELVLVDNIMEASFSEVGCILHPVINLLNTSCIESNKGFLFYIDGVTPAIAKVIDSLDAERICIAQAYDISVESVSNTTKRYYDSSGSDIISVLRSTDTYKNVSSPSCLDNRFFNEDVMISLNLYKKLAVLAGIEIPIINSILSLTKCISSDSGKIESRDFESMGGEDEYLKMKNLIASHSV